MLQQINKKIILYIFLLIILGTLNNKNLKDFNLPNINTINIEGIEINNKNFLASLDLLKMNNLFFVDKFQVKEILNSNNLIEEYEVIKKYPSVLKVKIKKTNFLASTNRNGKKYLVGSNGKFIETKKHSQELPYVFGNFEIKKFLEFQKIISETDLNLKNIKNFYSFPSGRWDIEMTSGILIKLPINEIKNSLNLSSNLFNDTKFSNIKILDLRQKSQIVVND
tara:strand:- start:2005 stop:2673 length:669 start_codon:yes stop_codon:yes gene_type:complete